MAEDRLGPSGAAFFAELAGRLHAEADSQGTVDLVAEYARAATICEGAGVCLLHAGRRVSPAAATTPRVRRADELQGELGEGPCLSCILDTGSDTGPDSGFDTVNVGDARAEPRFARWAPAVVELGFLSVLSVRLRTHARTIGALSLYSAQPQAFGPEEIGVAHIFARHASLALANSHDAEGLHRAIDSRKLIGQAQGILMERYAIDADQAFAMLRRYSQRHNVKLVSVAQQVVETRAVADPQRGSRSSGNNAASRESS